MVSSSSTQDKAPSGSATPSKPAPQQAEPTPLSALLADLSILDGRLHHAVERVRATIPDGVDPGNRGLLIEESDVDGWLTSLGNVRSGRPTGEGDGVASAQYVGQPGGRLYALSYLFGLGPFERATILTALAPEVELDYANLFAYVHDDVTKKYPTLDLVVSLWCDTVAERLETRRLLGPEGTLRRHYLLSIDDSPTQHTSLLARSLTLDPRIAAFLLGADEPDHALGGAARVVRPNMQDGSRGNPAEPDKQVASLAQLVMALLSPQQQGNGAATPPRRRGLTVWMRGLEAKGKRQTAEHLAATLGAPLLTIDVPVLLAASGNPRTNIYRALREARLQGAIIYWSGADALLERPETANGTAPGPDLGKDLARSLADWYGCALFDLKAMPPPHILSGPVTIELDFPAPTNEQRADLWERALGGKARLAEDVNLPLLIGAFRLAGEQIEAAAESARQAAAWRAVSSGTGEEARITMHDLLTACRTHSNQSLGMLARKITPHYTWNDLVLPADRLAQLHEMCHHIHHGPLVFEQWGFGRKLARGKGLNVLFAGQPGTGKTMGAEVIATDLGLELYKIDLSSVVSKYIGETEKNLEKIFNEGQTSNAILFFDEADSLFGKRSAVKDSHDRYANIETSYLLQRMEEYDGIIILASNLRKNMDDAFIRRLHGALEFPMPEEPDRLEIWRRTFPAEAPVADDIDLPYLAKQLKLSGGNIKNIVLEAAFLAAEAGTAIGMFHLVKATRREHQKIGKLFHDSDFGQYAYMLRGEEVVGDVTEEE